MSLTDVLRHPWLDSSASSSGDAASSSATTRDGIGRGLGDVSELSEFPEDDLVGANRDASMLLVVPSSDDMPGVHDLNISSPPHGARKSSLASWPPKLKLRLRPPLMPKPNSQCQALPRPRSTAPADTAENDVVLRNTGGRRIPLSMSRWTVRAPSRTWPRWTLSRSLVRRSAEGAARISSRMMARRLRLFGMVEVAGTARDGCCARGALVLWAVRAANRVVDRSSRMLVKEVQ